MTKPAARWLALLPSLVAVLLFAPSLGFEFLEYDDRMLLTGNGLVQHASLENLTRLWSGPLFGDYHPVTLTVYCLEWQLSGGNPAVHHAVSLALHGLSVWLVLQLLWPRLGLQRAAAAALLFGVHPLVVEPIAWIASRKDLLALPLLLGAVLLCRRALADAERVRWSWGAAGLGLAVLAVLAKSVAVVFPALLVWDWWCGRPRWRRPTSGELTLFALAVIPALVAVGAKLFAWDQIGAAGVIAPQGLVGRADLTVVTYGTFLGHALAPAGLHLAYDPTGLEDWQRVASYVALLALPFLGWLLRERRGVLLGLGWWGIALLPAAQIFPFHIWAADRYAYPALPGLAAVVAILLVPRGAVKPTAGRIAFAALLALATWLSWQQLRIWQNPETLWAVHAAREPHNRVAVPNLARVLVRGAQERRRVGAALEAEALERSARDLLAEHLHVEPDNHRAGRLYAQLLVRAGKTGEAEDVFVKHTPCVEHVAYLVGAGRRRDAEVILRVGLRERPNAPDLLRMKAHLAAGAGEHAEAQAALAGVVRADPTAFADWVALAQAAGRAGDDPAGWEAVSRAHHLGAPDYVVRAESARLLVLKGQPELARGELLAAISLEPLLARHLVNDPELGPLLRRQD